MLSEPTILPVLTAWVHDLDPRAIGPIRWYGLSYVAGFIVAWLLVRRIASTGRSPINTAQVTDLILILALGVVIGGRIGYALFYQPELFWSFRETLPWWNLLAIQDGGMASHGGMLGAVVAAGLYAWRQKISTRFLVDLLAFGAPLGLFFGRIANFINGELFGRRASQDLPWAVKFPQEMRDWSPDELVRVQPALAQLDPEAAAQWPIWIEQWRHTSEQAWLQLQYQIGRMIDAVQAGGTQGQAVQQALEPILTPRHPSQIYAALLEGLAVFLAVAIVWARPRNPGIAGATFAIAYGIGRIINEFFRRPDPHLLEAEFALLGITRGQLLSGVLLLIGLIGLWYFRKHPLQPAGGWLKA